jgi:gelsolin
MEGGLAAGFRHVKPEDYKPRLFQVRRTRKTVRAFEVPVKASSLNKEDVFILDAGLQIYVYIGERANAFEKMKGGALAHNLVGSRQGKSKLMNENDDVFWNILQGGAGDVQPMSNSKVEEDLVKLDRLKLFRVSGNIGDNVAFCKEYEGRINVSMLDANDSFLIDAGPEIFFWIGNQKSSLRLTALQYVDEYIQSQARPNYLAVTVILDGQVHPVFMALIKA